MDQNTAEYQKIGFKEFFQITRWTLSILFKLYPFKTALWVGTAILQQSQDFIYTLIFAKVIDALMETAQKPGVKIETLYPYLFLILGYSVLISILSYLRSYAGSSLRYLCRPKIYQSFYYKLNSLGIQTLEQPEVNDKINRADTYLNNLLPYVSSTIQAIASLIKTIASIIIVVSFLPLFAPLMMLISLPYLFFDRWMRRTIYKLDYENTENRRRANSLGDKVINSKDLQEITITGAFNYLDHKYIDFFDWLNEKRMQIINKSRTGGYIFGFITDSAIILGYIQIFTKLITKVISVGEVVFWMRTLNIFQNALSDTMQYFNDLWENSIQLKDTYYLFHIEPSYKDGNKVMPALTCGPSIEFKNVTFKYPRSEREVIQNLNLNIKPGEKLAIVGKNGAGKTTLIKLISRLYQINSGEILVNNTNINDLKADTLYKNMGVLFQDFNIYPQLTVKENILIGNAEAQVDKEKIRKAAEIADAINFIEDYPNKFDQILSESYKGGIRPSTGQWQKIAIARFFYRNAPLVIFDEPTASIDAISEYNIFNKIYEFFNQKTVIIISHRFSTVRNADRIIVLDGGKIIEEGTHAELMQKNGYYTEAFLLQARGYEQ